MVGATGPELVATPAGPVAVHVLGAGRPTVLWHAVPGDGSSWGYAIPALLPGRRLLVVDGPGWGRSGPARAYGSVVAAAARVVEALAPSAAVDWVGAGWGGRVGLALAHDRPELIRSLVLVAADPRPMPAAQRRGLLPVLAGLAVLGPVGPVGRALVADGLSPASRTEPQTVGAVLDALLLAGRLRAARAILTTEVLRPDLTGLLPAVAAPTLLLGGDAASALPEAEAARLAALAPFARSGAVPGARALVPLDRPDAMADAVLAFWSDLADRATGIS